MAPIRAACPLRRALSTFALTAVVLTAATACSMESRPAPRPSSAECAHTRPPRPVPYTSLPAGPFTQVVAAAGGNVIGLPAATLAFQDFTPADGTFDGGVIGGGGLIGMGQGRSVLEVAPSTSTHAGDIPTTFPATNQLSVLRVGTLESTSRIVLSHFSVQGTEQGHLYNGLRVERVRNLRASDIRVTAIPGGASSPPGETFGINDFRTTGSQWSKVVVDGAGVGASGFGVNNATDIQICDTVSNNNRYGMGFAFWQSNGITCVDCIATDNGRAGFNFERVTGSNELVRPRATGNTYGIRISNDLGTGRFLIVDPRLTDGHLTVTLPYRYNGSANRQKASDITLVVRGKERPDLLRIQRY